MKPSLVILPSSDLLTIYEPLYATDCSLETKVPGIVSANADGCLSQVLFAQAHGNAPQSPPHPLSQCADATYTALLTLLQERAYHILHATVLDDNLEILHPGISDSPLLFIRAEVLSEL